MKRYAVEGTTFLLKAAFARRVGAEEAGEGAKGHVAGVLPGLEVLDAEAFEHGDREGA